MVEFSEVKWRGKIMIISWKLQSLFANVHDKFAALDFKIIAELRQIVEAVK